MYVTHSPFVMSVAELNTINQEKEFVFDEADRQFDLLFNGIRAGRSLAASYNLQSDIQGSCFNDRQKGLLLTC
jgi:hypothetical protein